MNTPIDVNILKGSRVTTIIGSRFLDQKREYVPILVTKNIRGWL